MNKLHKNRVNMSTVKRKIKTLKITYLMEY